MAKEVIISPVAEINYENIIEYLTLKWGIKVANNFIDRFDEVCDLLVKTPEVYPFIDKIKRVQKCILTKHNILYFTEAEETIKILIIFDTRQDPKKLLALI